MIPLAVIYVIIFCMILVSLLMPIDTSAKLMNNAFVPAVLFLIAIIISIKDVMCGLLLIVILMILLLKTRLYFTSFLTKKKPDITQEQIKAQQETIHSYIQSKPASIIQAYNDISPFSAF